MKIKPKLLKLLLKHPVIKPNVMRHKCGALSNLYKTLCQLIKLRRSPNHLVGNTCQFGHVRVNSHLRVHQRDELIYDFTIFHYEYCYVYDLFSTPGAARTFYVNN